MPIRVERAEKPRDILIRNIPLSTTDDELREVFKQFGEIDTCEHKREKTTERGRGFAFVRFTTMESQQAALDRGMVKIGGNKCEIKLPFDKVRVS